MMVFGLEKTCSIEFLKIIEGLTDDSFGLSYRFVEEWEEDDGKGCLDLSVDDERWRVELDVERLSLEWLRWDDADDEEFFSFDPSLESDLIGFRSFLRSVTVDLCDDSTEEVSHTYFSPMHSIDDTCFIVASWWLHTRRVISRRWTMIATRWRSPFIVDCFTGLLWWVFTIVRFLRFFVSIRSVYIGRRQFLFRVVCRRCRPFVRWAMRIAWQWFLFWISNWVASRRRVIGSWLVVAWRVWWRRMIRWFCVGVWFRFWGRALIVHFLHN